MNIEEIRTCLMRAPLFRELSDASLAFIAESATPQTLQPETTVYDQGAAATKLYVLVEGEVSLRQTATSGAVHELERRRPPDVFGEAAIWDEGPRMLTAYVTEPTSVLIIERKMLEPLLGPESRFVKGMLAYITGVLRRANERMRRLDP